MRQDGGDGVDEILLKLLEIEKQYGDEIFLKKNRVMAFMKDYFPQSKKEQRLVERGLELNIYNKVKSMSPSDILIYRNQILNELYYEHGLNETAAGDTVDIWIKLVEHKRDISIITNETKQDGFDQVSAIGKAFSLYKNSIKKDKQRIIDVYSKNTEKKEDGLKDSVIYEAYRRPELDRDSVRYNSAARNKSKLTAKTMVYTKSDRDAFKNAAYKDKDVIDTCFDKANNNDISAQMILGELYYSGSILGQDYKEAFKWFQKAAEQGESQAQNNLGFCYFEGKGVEKNVPLALEWFKRAAYQGELSAMLSLANCYYDAMGVKRDIEKALDWYRAAAEKKDPTAQYVIGECYYKGDGLKKSKIEAIKWFELAAKQNHVGATERLKELGNYRTMMSLRKTDIPEKILHTNSELYAQRFVDKMMMGLHSEELLSRMIIYSETDELLTIIKNKLTGFGFEPEKQEYALFLFSENPTSILRLSESMLLTTKGIYLYSKLKRKKFLYYAEVFKIEQSEEDTKIQINDTFISCQTLAEKEINILCNLIKDTAREFK